MAIRALTLDFWNTIVVARSGGERRQQQRLDFLLDVVRACRPEADEAEVKAAFRVATERYFATWTQHHRTPSCSDLVGGIWEALGLEVAAPQHEEAVRLFEEGILFGPPALAEGLHEALAWAAGRYRLGIISDTMFSPGRIIRRLLDQHGILHYFEAFVFSDEAGFSKPDRRAFHQASAQLDAPLGALVHIGDLRRTDVGGAQQAGARALLYTGVRHDEDDAAEPDAVLPHWADLPAVLNGLQTPP